MASYNKILLLGNMTRDPQLSYLPSGQAVVDFGVATNRKWTDQNGQPREDICFVDCRMFGKRAEVISRYFKKGTPIFVEGRLTLDTWTAQDGSKKSRHRVTVDGFEFVGGSQGNAQGGNGGYQNQNSGYAPQGGNVGGGYNQAPQAQAYQPQQYAPAPSAVPPMPVDDGFSPDGGFGEDEIPF